MNQNPPGLGLEEPEPPRFPGPGGRRPQPYKFSPDEARVLRECNRDSFYQRCVPFATILGFSTYYGVKTGYLRPNLRWGAIPKVSAAVIVGYFLGKFSYQSKCAEKLMQLPNSQLGEILRQRRKGVFQESLDQGFGPAMSLAPFSGISPSDTYTDVGPLKSVDIDTTRPQYEGLDDSHRPSIDNPIYEEEMPPEQKHVTTYEELRKKNREEYQGKRIGNFRDRPNPSPAPAPARPPTSRDGSTLHRNQYGDVVE